MQETQVPPLPREEVCLLPEELKVALDRAQTPQGAADSSDPDLGQVTFTLWISDFTRVETQTQRLRELVKSYRETGTTRLSTAHSALRGSVWTLKFPISERCKVIVV